MEKHSSMDDQFISLIHRIIEDNLDNEKFSVNELAEKAGLSRSMLHRKLTKLTGKSSIQLITEIRLERALELLENDVATASEIAYKVGFSDPNYFFKVFKKHFNISPGEVRKKGADRKELIASGWKQEIQTLLRSKGNSFYVKTIPAFLLVVFITFALTFLLSTNYLSKKSIAVLPFENLTGQEENKYFIDGLQDLLIGELGKNKSLRVLSKQSTLRYRGSDMSMPDIGREIGAEILIEGTFQCLDDNICFEAKGIDVRTKEKHILIGEYYDGVDNLLGVQASVVKDIAEKLKIKLSKKLKKRLSESRKTDPETWNIYFEGMNLIDKGTTESFIKGINFLARAIKKDPTNSIIKASLALALALRGHALIDPNDSFEAAEYEAQKALLFDPTCSEAHTALALVYLYQKWDWPKAKAYFEDAINNNPSKDIAHAHFAWYHVQFGEFEKAIDHAKKAVNLNLASASYKSWLAWLYFLNEEYEEAETWASECLELDDQINFGKLVMGWVYLKKNQNKEALAIFEQLPETRDYYLNFMGYCYIKTGNRDKAQAIWNECEQDPKSKGVNPVCKGLLAGMLGHNDRAFELFDEAFEKRTYPLIHIETLPSAEYIRDDPRYIQLLEKMNVQQLYPLLASK